MKKLIFGFIIVFFVMTMIGPRNGITYSGESILQPALFGCMATAGSKIATDVYEGIVRDKPLTEKESIDVKIKNDCVQICDNRFKDDNDGFTKCIEACK